MPLEIARDVEMSKGSSVVWEQCNYTIIRAPGENAAGEGNGLNITALRSLWKNRRHQKRFQIEAELTQKE